jgi:hypothetical protein
LNVPEDTPDTERVQRRMNQSMPLLQIMVLVQFSTWMMRGAVICVGIMPCSGLFLEKKRHHHHPPSSPPFETRQACFLIDSIRFDPIAWQTTGRAGASDSIAAVFVIHAAQWSNGGTGGVCRFCFVQCLVDCHCLVLCRVRLCPGREFVVD